MSDAAVVSGTQHRWRFFRAGGFDQVRLDHGADIMALDQLDLKLWLALSCPTRGVEFDTVTLDLIDTDKDGHIRAPEILAAIKWVGGLLKDAEELVRGRAELPLSAINDATPEGKQILASARRILANLGKGEATGISVADTSDTTKIFALPQFNGDGVITPDATTNAALQAVIAEILATQGGKMDRSGKEGVDQAAVDAFYAEAAAYAAWWKAGQDGGKATMPLGEKTADGAAALEAVALKVDDYFARCELAAFDERALAAMNRDEKEYAAIAVRDLSLGSAEIAAFPLARVAAGKPLPLKEGLNPAWAGRVEALVGAVIWPLAGDKTVLTEKEWREIKEKFAGYDAWKATKPATKVEALGLARITEVLGNGSQAAITGLIAQDLALEGEANAIAAVDRLVRYHRDLHKLLLNFVNFRDFYSRREKAIFQVGTLYLDQRSCDLCIVVTDAAKHATMAHLSYAYLAYCDLTRKATGETMTIAAAFTNGDSDNLMVGRNGLFYDRRGNDWDATITKIIENPISIRQAFWSPYKRCVRYVQDLIAKRAAAADSVAQQKLAADAANAGQVLMNPAPVGGTPAAAGAAAAATSKRIDVGAVAALGVALGTLSTAFGYFLNWLNGTPLYYIPVYALVVLLVISFPSMILAALKLRQRNLGPILDANGWAVNAKARLNIPFGASLTGVPKLPPGSHRDLLDPYAERHRMRSILISLGCALVVCGALWYFGAVEHFFPGALPKSGFIVRRELAAQAQKDAEAAAVEKKKQEDAAKLTETQMKSIQDRLKALEDKAAATGPGPEKQH